MEYLEIFIYLISMLVAAYGICGLTPRRLKPRDFAIFATVIIGIIVWSTFDNLYLRLLLQELLIFILFYLFDETIRCRIFFSIYLPAAHSILINIESVFFQINNIEYSEIVLPLILLGIIIFFSVITRIIARVQLKEISVAYGILLLVALAVDAITTVYLGNFIIFEEIENELNRFDYIAMYYAVVAGVIFKFVLIIRLVITSQASREKEHLAAKYLEEQREHYDYLRKQEEDTRRFRHDIQNHISVLRSLVSNGDNRSLAEYVEAMGGVVDGLSHIIKVNNDIANAIFNKYYYIAKEQGIDLVVEGHFPNQCVVSTLDLSIILSNLMDNAIRAETEAGKTQVHVWIKHDERGIFIEVTNDIKEIPDIRDDIIRTTKKDKNNHGIGMKNIRDCVKKNHGDIVFSVEDYKLVELIYLENKGNSNEDSNC